MALALRRSGHAGTLSYRPHALDAPLPTLTKKERKQLAELSCVCSVDGKIDLQGTRERAADLYMDSFVTSRYQGTVMDPVNMELVDSGTGFRVSRLRVNVLTRVPHPDAPERKSVGTAAAVPKGLMILLRVWAHHFKYGEDARGHRFPTSDTFTLLALGLGVFEDFAKGGILTLRHVDTFNAMGAVMLRGGTRPRPPLPVTDVKACGDLSSDFAVPIYSLIDNGAQVLQPAFAEYLTAQERQLRKYDLGEARYPGGTPWSWEAEHPKIVRHPFGDIPMALFLYNRSRTPVRKNQVNALVRNFIFRVLVEEGFAVADYLTKGKLSQKQLLLVASRTLRKITSLLTDYPDCYGESWTMPFAEASLTRASIDCEELATLCAYVYRCVMATDETCEICTPVRTILAKNYIGLHVLCLARFGPTEDPRGEKSQVWMHVNYGLIRNDLFAFLTGARRSLDPDTELPGYVLIEGSDDTQCSPLLTRGRPGLDLNEIDAFDAPHDRTMGSFMTWQAEHKFRYYGHVVGFFDVDTTCVGPDQKNHIEYTPLSRGDEKSQDWSIGIPMSDLVEGVVEEFPERYRLLEGPPVPAMAWKLAHMFARMYSDTTNIGFQLANADRAGYAVLDAKTASTLASTPGYNPKFVRRVAFVAFDDKFRGKGLTIQQRLAAASAAAQEFGREHKLPLYESLRAELLSSDLFYSGDGLPPAYCVVVFNRPSGHVVSATGQKKKQKQKIDDPLPRRPAEASVRPRVAQQQPQPQPQRADLRRRKRAE